MDSSTTFQGLDALPTDQQVLVSRFGRGPTVPVPHSTVHQAFEHAADAHPSATAATHRDKSITYSELDTAANRLANHLIDSGLQPRQRVCLVVQRSFEMLVGIFAILKAGCQYVPVDGGVASDEAIRHIMTDTACRFVLCLPKFEEKVERLAASRVVIVPLGIDVEAFTSKSRPRVEVTPADGIYAIYTSGMFLVPLSILPRLLSLFTGSTGKPKGVDVSHGNVTNALLLRPANLGISHGSKVGQFLNVAFDMGKSYFCTPPLTNYNLLINSLQARGRSWHAS